ncbi:MAG: DUF2244 domain-containing protein [Halofilum sp. (in: g-proteobacteria)]|nr:DUF2244 domain-containing protein [Halofilum sp. (in: g-proteobacteria)]
MIERELSTDGRFGRYVLRPHRSATWSDNLWLVAAIALMAVPVAMAWAVAGFWLILPLCGLELGLLTLGLYVVNHSLLAQEVITIDEDQITIEAGKREVERRFELARDWAQVLLQPARRRAHPARLIVRSHGRAVELGRFLTDDEREELAGDLRGVLARPGHAPPRQTAPGTG